MEHAGYLLLADISGYTEFVTQTEIDHGNQVLESLIEVIVGEIRTPFVVQEIEGDAVFAWALGADVRRGEIVLDLIEGLYSAFRDTLQTIERDSTCRCRACATAPDLDLKFIVHFGAFADRDIAGHTGIGGPAVVLAHRLLKNRVTEATHCRAYAFLSAPAIDALDINGVTDGMTAHSETYEHLGAIDGWVHDLSAYWDRVSAERTVIVPEDGAIFVTSFAVPGSPLLAWQVYTDPRQRQRWLHTDGITVEGLTRGRYGPGTLEHCAHGKGVQIQKTLDWKPVRYVTQANLLPFGGELPYTAWFDEDAAGTRVKVVFGPPVHGNRFVQAILRLMVRLGGPSAQKKLRANYATYVEMVARLAAAQVDTAPATN